MIHLINAIVMILAAVYIYYQHKALKHEHTRANLNAENYWAIHKELVKWKHYHDVMSQTNRANYERVQVLEKIIPKLKDRAEGLVESQRRTIAALCNAEERIRAHEHQMKLVDEACK